MNEKKNSEKVKNKKKNKKILKTVMFSILAVILLAVVAAAGIGLAIINTAPALDVNQILTLKEPSKLYDKDGKEMDDVATNEKRDVVEIKDVAQDLPNAFISIEDERFYSHKGVDVQRVFGVIYLDIKNKLSHKSGLQGASTITQQLVRNAMLSNIQNEKNIMESSRRKIQEMYLSLELEKHLSKTQILEAYMNTIPFGGNVHGVEAAAQYYFNKDAKDLTLIQSAYIAGVPQAPGIYNAFLDSAKKDPSKYLNRTKMVLSAMYKNNYINKDQYDKAVSSLSEKTLAFNQTSIANNNRLNYEWFSLPAIEQVKKDLKAQFDYSDDEINSLLMYGGLKIYTTMDTNLQNAAQKVLDDNKNYGINNTSGTIIQPQASAVIMDYHTGEVKAIIGGRGAQPARSYNRAAFNGSKDFSRPTGSSIKPLTVYGPAIDTKLATAATVVEDSPLPVEIGNQWPENGKPYNPRNYETGYFRGYVTIREAIKSSINLVAIKEEYNIGLKTGVSYGEKFGLTFDNNDKTSLSALSLGQLHHGTNTLTMAAAFGTFGNNGMYTEPKMYTKVVDRRGVTILESKVVNRKVLSPQASYIMYDLLKGPTSSGGTGPSAKFSSMPAAGKTGTSGDKRDFWFCGLTPYYSGAVWIGNDDTKPIESGISSNTSAALWGKIMKEAHKDLPVKDIQKPTGIITTTACKDSGEAPTDLCSKDPRGSQVISEMFISGTQPTTLCDIHVEANINKANGKIATENTPKDLLESRIFIKRDYTPTESLEDQPYVLPTEIDDTKPAPPTIPTEDGTGTGTGTTNPPDTNTNPNTNKNTNPIIPPLKPNDITNKTP